MQDIKNFRNDSAVPRLFNRTDFHLLDAVGAYLFLNQESQKIRRLTAADLVPTDGVLVIQTISTLQSKPSSDSEKSIYGYQIVYRGIGFADGGICVFEHVFTQWDITPETG